MGLRTASSVRRPPYAEEAQAMAPALTEAGQNNLKGLPLPEPERQVRREVVDDDDAHKTGLKHQQQQHNNSIITSNNNNNRRKPSEEVEDDLILMEGVAGMAPPDDDELLQVIKSIETNPEKFLMMGADMMNISMDDVDVGGVMMSGNPKESKSEEMIAELKERHAKMERRLDFLRRKIQKLQARQMGQHLGEEVAGVYEYVHRSLKQRVKDPPPQPAASTASMFDTTPAAYSDEQQRRRSSPISYGSTRSMLRKLEMAATLQANSLGRQKNAAVVPKYFGSGSSEGGGATASTSSGGGGGYHHRLGTGGAATTSTSAAVTIPPWPQEHKVELQRCSGAMRSHLEVVKQEVDSEATDSSSGGESCDEWTTYSNPHQQYLSIQKRALWKYASARAAVAARWTWLQAQISDLEYRIRQHTELHRQIRAAKGTITLGRGAPPLPADGAPGIDCAGGSSPSSSTATPLTALNGYRGQLPGDSKEAGGADDDGECAARTRPLIHFKKRKLLQLGGLHAVSKKAARPSSVRCGCRGSTTSGAVCCALCTGRTDPTHPRVPSEALGKTERVALVDPAFHPVLSVLPDDVSYAIHCDAIMKQPDWQQRSSRMKSLKGLMKIGGGGGAAGSGGLSPPAGLMGAAASGGGPIGGVDKGETHHRGKKVDQRRKYNRVLKPSTASALSAKIKNKIRGRKSAGLSSSSSTYKTSTSRRQSLKSVSGAAGGFDSAPDDELDSFDYMPTTRQGHFGGGESGQASTAPSPCQSPLLHMQSISGYNKRARANSYDIDNIVIPYSVAASTRVEKLQYKEILTPKWRIADLGSKSNSQLPEQPEEQQQQQQQQKQDQQCDGDGSNNGNGVKNNGAMVVRNPSQDSDVEDLSEEAVVVRHDKSEHDERKKFLSYLKFPPGSGGGYHARSARSHKRTDSMAAESSGGNTPDPMSPTAPTNSDHHGEPATPPLLDEPPLPSIGTAMAAARRRTMSQSSRMFARGTSTNNNGGGGEEFSYGNFNNSVGSEDVEEAVLPFDTRTFPLDDDSYGRMLKVMPENHRFQTNARAQDSVESGGGDGEAAPRPGGRGVVGAGDNDDSLDFDYVMDEDDVVGGVASPGSESTESALAEEDPNDPEWLDMERARDRHKR